MSGTPHVWRVFSEISDPCAIATSDGVIEFVNDAFCEEFGIERDAAVGARDRVVMFGLEPDAVDPLDRAAVLAGRVAPRERVEAVGGRDFRVFCDPRPDGGCGVIYLHTPAERGGPAGLGALRGFRDVERAQKREAVGRLASGMAHDFNNILSVIIGFTEVALGDLEPESGLRAPLGEIQKAVDRAAILTRQLLAMVHQQDVKPQVCQVNEVIEQLEAVLRRVIDANVTLQTDLADDLPTVRADPGQLDQVLTNLVVNARDAMPGGGVLTIGTSFAPAGTGPLPDRDCVALAVRDTGLGIDEALLDAIFEPFFTTKEAGQGTGLGLSVAQGIVEQSRGTLRVASEVGRGSTFTVYLPVGGEGAGAGASPRAAAAPSAHGATDAGTRPATPGAILSSSTADATTTPANDVGGSGTSGATMDGAPSTQEAPVLAAAQTILLVEDEEMLRHLLSSVLKRAGYRVFTASDGLHGWEKFERMRSEGAPADLLLTDIVMPKLGGIGLAERATQATPDLPVLFISGYRDRDPPPGATVLNKPFSNQMLLAEVRRVLGSPRV